jgi:hypothetical protein
MSVKSIITLTYRNNEHLDLIKSLLHLRTCDGRNSTNRGSTFPAEPAYSKRIQNNYPSTYKSEIETDQIGTTLTTIQFGMFHLPGSYQTKLNKRNHAFVSCFLFFNEDGGRPFLRKFRGSV